MNKDKLCSELYQEKKKIKTLAKAQWCEVESHLFRECKEAEHFPQLEGNQITFAYEQGAGLCSNQDVTGNLSSPLNPNRTDDCQTLLLFLEDNSNFPT